MSVSAARAKAPPPARGSCQSVTSRRHRSAPAGAHPAGDHPGPRFSDPAPQHGAWRRFNTAAGDSDTDLITDFQVGDGGDTLHIGNILEGYSGGSDINDFLRIALDGGQTKVQIDVDGTANGVNFVNLAILNGISSGLSVDTLFANNQIDTTPVND